MTSHFKALISGEQFCPASKPDPEIFLTSRQGAGHHPAEHAGAGITAKRRRAGARGGFCHRDGAGPCPADDEMRRLYTAECRLRKTCAGVEKIGWREGLL